MANKIYTVTAFRWGDTENHSYIVGVYPKKQAAINAANDEAQWRGGKYECEVREWTIGAINEDKSPRMPNNIIKSLRPVKLEHTTASYAAAK